MKLEIGGGGPDNQRGDGWVNVDQTPTADVIHDLTVFPWPFADESVAEAYSSHCLEHLNDPVMVLREIARICKVGAPVEIRVPNPLSDMAMACGHKHVLGPVELLSIDRHFQRISWVGVRRLKLLRIAYAPSIIIEEAKADLPFLTGLSDEVIMKWIPRTCHECQFFYEVIVNEFYEGVIG